MQSKHSTSYEPAYISPKRYDEIVHGRNRFILATLGGAAGFFLLTALPQYCISRSVRHIYRKYCTGKVLDVSPKLYDKHDVSLYELSRAVVVNYRVARRVTDEGFYRIDHTLSEEQQNERRKAMTLDFMMRHDHHWVGSSVNFDIVEDADMSRADFRSYNCVVCRDELMLHSADEARRLLNSAARYIDTSDGVVLIMDFGKPHIETLARALSWFNRVTKSSMCLTHDYRRWIREDHVYDVVHEQRTLFGMHYSLVLRPRNAPRKSTCGDDMSA